MRGDAVQVRFRHVAGDARHVPVAQHRADLAIEDTGIFRERLAAIAGEIDVGQNFHVVSP
jgi:hypothetical protein